MSTKYPYSFTRPCECLCFPSWVSYYISYCSFCVVDSSALPDYQHCIIVARDRELDDLMSVDEFEMLLRHLSTSLLIADQSLLVRQVTPGFRLDVEVWDAYRDMFNLSRLHPSLLERLERAIEVKDTSTSTQDTARSL